MPKNILAWSLSIPALIGLFVCSVPSPTYAAVIRGGEEFILATSSVLADDFYFLGKQTALHGTTTGDVIAGGSHVILGGVVEQEVFVAAGRVTMTGSVAGDARIAAGIMSVSGEVGEDLVAAGGTVLITKDAVIHGDLLVYSDRTVIEGTVEGTVEVYARTAQLMGTVGHGATFHVGESLGLSGEANVGGDLRYTAPRKAFISNTAKVQGENVFTPREGGSVDETFDLAMLMLRICVGAGAAAFLAWLFPNFSAQVATRAQQGSGLLIFKGFVFLFAIPVLAFLSVCTILGALPGFLLFIGYIFGLGLASAVSGVIMGMLIAQWCKRTDGLRPPWAMLGAIVLALITLVPGIGWFVRALVLLLAFGTLLTLIYESFWLRRK